MPYVERSVLIAAEARRLYELAKEMESFPRYMPNVKEVTVIERSEGSTVTRWHVNIIGRDFRWTERDDFDEEKLLITYKQLEGDVKKFEGEWRFEEADDGKVRVVLSCDAELGVPMLNQMFNPVLKKALEMNVDKMLEAIKAQAERA